MVKNTLIILAQYMVLSTKVRPFISRDGNTNPQLRYTDSTEHVMKVAYIYSYICDGTDDAVYLKARHITIFIYFI